MDISEAESSSRNEDYFQKPKVVKWPYYIPQIELVISVSRAQKNMLHFIIIQYATGKNNKENVLNKKIT